MKDWLQCVAYSPINDQSMKPSLIGCSAIWTTTVELLSTCIALHACMCTATYTSSKFHMNKFCHSLVWRRACDCCLIAQVPLDINGEGTTLSPVCRVQKFSEFWTLRVIMSQSDFWSFKLSNILKNTVFLIKDAFSWSLYSKTFVDHSCNGTLQNLFRSFRVWAQSYISHSGNLTIVSGMTCGAF